MNNKENINQKIVAAERCREKSRPSKVTSSRYDTSDEDANFEGILSDMMNLSFEDKSKKRERSITNPSLQGKSNKRKSSDARITYTDKTKRRRTDEVKEAEFTENESIDVKKRSCSDNKSIPEDQQSKDESMFQYKKKKKQKKFRPNQFFENLLRTDIDTFVNSDKWEACMTEICERAGVPFPAPLNKTDSNIQEFFGMRASLVLEEARCALVESLNQVLHEQRHDTTSILVKLFNATKKGGGRDEITVLTFGSNSDMFTFREREALRPGAVFLLSICYSTGLTKNYLANVQPNQRVKRDSTVSLAVYQLKVADLDEIRVEEAVFRLTYITTMISHQRQFMACKNWSPHCPLLNDLMGLGQNDMNTNEGQNIEGNICVEYTDQNRNSFLSSISIPTLNSSQRSAASSFISRNVGLSLVQGPPGTGKSTFLNSVLCQSFLERKLDETTWTLNKEKRILVTAPTNRAVLVNCEKFLQVTNEYVGLKVLLIGNQDKLLSKKCGALKRVFIDTWLEALIDDLSALQLDLTDKCVQKAKTLIEKLATSIPKTAKTFQLGIGGMQNLLHTLSSKNINKAKQKLKELVNKSRNLLDKMEAMKKMKKELLSTSNIIFSTLSTAGSSLMKGTKIDELFVDEAGATTEAEILIPMNFRPSKMLIVGDPRQLPSFVLSRRASEFGFERSLLERLMMHGKGATHTMLNVQYRMHPEISKFPNKEFYDGKLKNADDDHFGDNLKHGKKPYQFLTVRGYEERNGRGSYFNKFEAEEIVLQVKALNSYSWRIQIITFYSGQVEVIQRELEYHGLSHVSVATVDSMQGSESDIVFVSFVRTNRANIGFLRDPRRVNVAITRAKHKLICVGHDEALKQSKGVVQSLVKDAKRRNLMRTYKRIEL